MLIWSDIVEHIYCCHSNLLNISNDNELVNTGMMNSGIFSYEYYKIKKDYKNCADFKNNSFLEAVHNAYINNYKYILIFKDDLKFESNDYIENTLKNLDVSKYDYIVLNHGDICEDCILLSRKCITLINNIEYKLNNKNFFNTILNFVLTNKSIKKIYLNICHHKIDIVIPYLNNNFCGLSLLLRLIELYLKFVNNIFLITKKDIDILKINNNLINIIYLEDFIKDKSLLNNDINSINDNIELYFWNIKGLSEYFINILNINLLYNINKSILFNNGKINITTKLFNKNIHLGFLKSVLMHFYTKQDYNYSKFNLENYIIFSRNKQFDNIRIFDLIYYNKSKYEITKYINSNNEIILSTSNLSNKINIALCAIAKNENLYIREWVEYYKKLGISKIFLYDNNELDGELFSNVIGDYINNKFVEVINVRGVEKGLVYDKEGINLLTSCYIDCYENKLNNFDWVCFFDIDEFLVFKNKFNFQTFLANKNIKEFDTILVPWVLYDDNNILYYTSEKVMDKFTRLSKNKDYSIPKSIVRTGKNINDKKLLNLIHIFTLIGKKIISSDFSIPILNKKGDWYKFKEETIKNCNCVLNHYKTKSLEEFFKRHFGRNWGTLPFFTNTKRNYFDCLKDYYKYNWWNNTKAYALHPNLNYNAIITLTSWKKRIDTVYLTINNLKEVCGEKYKIVITLSIDEFPNKEKELPLSLLDTNIEIIWVQKNYGCYKKVLFAMLKYPNIPIISADDDCLYKYDYATELYEKWLKNPCSIISSLKSNLYIIDNIKYYFSHGCSTIYPPSVLLRLLPYIEDTEILLRKNDDSLYGIYLNKNNIKILYLNHNIDEVIEFFTNNDAITWKISTKEKLKEKFIEDKKLFISKLL